LYSQNIKHALNRNTICTVNNKHCTQVLVSFNCATS